MSVTVVAPEPPSQLLDLLAGPRGSALMLGHVHPDGDVLGTLLGLGLAMEKAGWTVTYGGPDSTAAFCCRPRERTCSPWSATIRATGSGR